MINLFSITLESLYEVLLLFTRTHDTHYRLLTDANMIQERTICGASKATRTTLDTVSNVHFFATIPLFEDRITHDKGRVKSHRTYTDALTATDTVTHGTTGRLLTIEEE